MWTHRLLDSEVLPKIRKPQACVELKPLTPAQTKLRLRPDFCWPPIRHAGRGDDDAIALDPGWATGFWYLGKKLSGGVGLTKDLGKSLWGAVAATAPGTLATNMKSIACFIQVVLAECCFKPPRVDGTLGFRQQRLGPGWRRVHLGHRRASSASRTSSSCLRFESHTYSLRSKLIHAIGKAGKLCQAIQVG